MSCKLNSLSLFGRKQRYLLDTNIFIEAKNTFYSFELCPIFWAWLIERAQTGDLCSISAVRDELIVKNKGKDAEGQPKPLGPLETWIKGAGAILFVDGQAKTSDLQALTQWVSETTLRGKRRFGNAAIHEFLNVADYQLVATAKSYGCVVVTREVSSPESKKESRSPTPAKELVYSTSHHFR